MPPNESFRYDGNPDGLPQHSVAQQASLLKRFNYKALHTSPSFFSINMGTGITSILLHNFPYKAFWLEILGVIVFVLNVVIFVVLLFLTIFRHVKFKNSFRVLLDHKTASMFWGCFPMGFVTIVVRIQRFRDFISIGGSQLTRQNMVAFVCVPAWGKHWAQLALGLWWIDVVVAIIVNLGMVFVMFTMHTHAPDVIAPTLLLPVVSTVVAAASGSVIAQSMLPYDPALGRSTLYTSFVIWGTGVPLALMMITIIMYKTISVGPPKLGAVMSSFLPLGPCGQGSYGILSMGITARKIVYEHSTPMIPKLSMDQNRIIADTMYGGCLVASLVLWGLALCFYVLAFSQVFFTLNRNWKWLGPNKFHAGMWGITFPIGLVIRLSQCTIPHGANVTGSGLRLRRHSRMNCPHRHSRSWRHSSRHKSYCTGSTSAC